jgi:hypothetical protein
MRICSAELSLDHLWIIYTGADMYPVTHNITALPLKNLESLRQQQK